MSAGAIRGQIGRFVPMPVQTAYPSWDGVKALRLPSDPCPHAADIAAVNAWANDQVVYRWGPARWQAPAETLSRGEGDCKDAVVLKRAILIAKGHAEEQLVVVVGQDLVLRQLHAVLWTPAGVLDQLADAVLQAPELLGVFEPELAFTEAQSFVYGMTAHG